MLILLVALLYLKYFVFYSILTESKAPLCMYISNVFFERCANIVSVLVFQIIIFITHFITIIIITVIVTMPFPRWILSIVIVQRPQTCALACRGLAKPTPSLVCVHGADSFTCLCARGQLLHLFACTGQTPSLVCVHRANSFTCLRARANSLVWVPP